MASTRDSLRPEPGVVRAASARARRSAACGRNSGGHARARFEVTDVDAALSAAFAAPATQPPDLVELPG
jgi:hypothetical protein